MVKTKHKKSEPAEHSMKLQHNLKSGAYSSGLDSMRKRLPETSRLFSHLSQSKFTDFLGSALSATIARSYALLVASLSSLVWTVLSVYFAKHYGYSYNYFLIIYSFIAGYILGIVIELLVKLFSKSK